MNARVLLNPSFKRKPQSDSADADKPSRRAWSQGEIRILRKHSGRKRGSHKSENGSDVAPEPSGSRTSPG